MASDFTLDVNGKQHRVNTDPDMPLLYALRNDIGLNNPKFGCGLAQCGACTVHIDGQAVRSCQVSIASIEGSFVTTIEGLSRDRSHPVQQAWVETNLPQCGYCQSGMIMAAAALLEKNHSPSDAEIDSAMTNICRCGTYPRIRRAIRRASRVMSGSEKIAAAPPPGIDPADAARAVPALDERGR